MMVSAVVDVDKNLTSLEKEDVFIASTTKLARLFFDIQHRESSLKLTNKGAGHSRSVEEQTTPAVTEDPSRDDAEDNAHLAAAEYVGRRLRNIAGEREAILTRAFDRYVDGIRHTIWDMNYETFQVVMREVVNSQQDHMSKIVWIFAGALHMSEAVRETGSDMIILQKEYLNKLAGFVGSYINDQGLAPWVEQQGGWEQIGKTSSDGTAV